MDLSTAVRTVLTKYAVFTGRARRSEYWWYTLATTLLGLVLSVLDRATGSSLLGTLVSIALFLPGLAVAVRRLHDTSRSGWWVLIGIVPVVGWIVLIVFYCQDSAPGTNQHGPSPKGYAGAYA